MIFNRQLQRKRIRAGSFRRMGLITTIAAISVLLILNNITEQTKAHSIYDETTIADSADQRTTEGVLKTVRPEREPESTPRHVSLAGITTPPNIETTSEIIQLIVTTPATPPNHPVRTAARTPPINLPVPSSIKSHELEGVIARTTLFIEHGDLKTAGRTLLPLLPHLDNEQLKRVINTLDTPVLNLFQKAYMIKPYEPERSIEILHSIIESRLEILPTYEKVKRMLEDSRLNQLKIND